MLFNGQQSADMATALGQLDTERRLTNAFGAQLDVLGDIVGEAREGDLDDEYRPRISAKILLNNSSGTAEELYAIFDLIKPATSTMALYPYEPAAFVFRLSGAAIGDTLATRLASFLRRGRGAGIRGIFQWSPAVPADTFTFDGTAAQALDTGLFSGATL